MDHWGQEQQNAWEERLAVVAIADEKPACHI